MKLQSEDAHMLLLVTVARHELLQCHMVSARTAGDHYYTQCRSRTNSPQTKCENSKAQETAFLE